MKRKNKKKIGLVIGIIVLLVFTFWYGGGSNSLRGFSTGESETVSVSQSAEKQQNEQLKSTAKKSEEAVEQENENIFKQFFMHITKKESSKSGKKQNGNAARKNANKATQKAESKKESEKKKNSKQKAEKTNSKNKQEADEQKTDTASNHQPDNTDASATKDGGGDSSEENGGNNAESETKGNDTEDYSKQPDNANSATADTGNTSGAAQDTNGIKCSISINCANLLNHMDVLDANKKKLVPSDGYILKQVTINVKKGSSVFDALKTVTKSKKIHLEYSGSYIEGIGNLYEFDGGELFGWMYSVNNDFPRVGCDSYIIQDGDVIQWVYTCDLGKDVGNYFKEE